MDSTPYLARIGVSTDNQSRDDVDLLHLQRRHLYTVPFTNHFIRRGNGTTLHPGTVVPRILAGGGGLCYDLNGAFAWLLKELGYDVALVSGRPMHDDSSYGPEYDHLALLVDDQLVDVGFGKDFARQPLPLNGDHRTDVSGTYRVFEDNDKYAAQKRIDGGWRDMYRFSLIPCAPDEFVDMLEYHATSSDAPFIGDLLVTLPTEDGRITLSGDSLTITDHGTRRKRDISSKRLDSVLRDRFEVVDRNS